MTVASSQGKDPIHRSVLPIKPEPGEKPSSTSDKNVRIEQVAQSAVNGQEATSTTLSMRRISSAASPLPTGPNAVLFGVLARHDPAHIGFSSYSAYRTFVVQIEKAQAKRSEFVNTFLKDANATGVELRQIAIAAKDGLEIVKHLQTAIQQLPVNKERADWEKTVAEWEKGFKSTNLQILKSDMQTLEQLIGALRKRQALPAALKPGLIERVAVVVNARRRSLPAEDIRAFSALSPILEREEGLKILNSTFSKTQFDDNKINARFINEIREHIILPEKRNGSLREKTEMKLKLSENLTALLKAKVESLLGFFSAGDQKELESANISSALQTQLLHAAEYAVTVAVDQVVNKRNEDLRNLFLKTVDCKQKIIVLLAKQPPDSPHKDFLAQLAVLKEIDPISIDLLIHLKAEGKRLKLDEIMTLIEERIQLEKSWSQDLFDSVWNDAGYAKILEQFERKASVELRDLMALGQIQSLEYTLQQSWNGAQKKKTNFLEFHSAVTSFLNLAEKKYLENIKKVDMYQYYKATNYQHVNDFSHALTQQMRSLKRDLIEAALNELTPQSASASAIDTGKNVQRASEKERAQRSAITLLTEGQYSDILDDTLTKRLQEFHSSLNRKRRSSI